MLIRHYMWFMTAVVLIFFLCGCESSGPDVLPTDTLESSTLSENASVVASTETGMTPAAQSENSLAATVESVEQNEATTEETEEVQCGIILSAEELSFFQLGQEQTLEVSGAASEDVFWSSDNLTVAMVAEGSVIAVGEGTTVIRAYYAGTEASCQVVSQPDVSLPALTIPESYYHQPVTRPPEVTEDVTDYFDDVILMGDSMSYMLYQWNNVYDEMGNTFFMTRGGVSINSLVIGSRKYFYKGTEMRPEDAVAACGRKKLYVMLGANDIPQFGIDKTMELWDALLGNILAETPDLEIYVQSLTPVWTPAEYEGFTNEIIDEYNGVLEQYCQENGYHYVDIADYFKDAGNGLARKYCSDNFVHTSWDGSALWAQCLKYYISHSEESGWNK